MTAQTTTPAAAHRFAAEDVHEPGYRPRCRVCGRDRHLHDVPTPRPPKEHP